MGGERLSTAKSKHARDVSGAFDAVMKGDDVESWSATVQATGFAVAGLSATVVVLQRGLVSLVGWLLAGACIASWAHVYARVMCAGKRLDWRLLVRSAGLGCVGHACGGGGRGVGWAWRVVDPWGCPGRLACAGEA